MEDRELQHIFHEHPLRLKAEQPKNNGGNGHPEVKIKCYICQIPISGPFYSCGECRYFLHKVCAELPSKLDHPLHQEHPLILSEKVFTSCNLCGVNSAWRKIAYHCSICRFVVDMKCASATHTIQDKCHSHPLTPVQVPIVFDCHICLKKEEGLSYKCNICPFWVHQNCTLLPDTVKHSDHSHFLTLLPSVPLVNNKLSQKCDICYNILFMFQSTYSCTGCLFFSHVNCARSPSTSREQNIDGQSVILLPLKQDSTNLISSFVGNYIDRDASIDNKIDHFDHEHPLILIGKETNDKTCEACAIMISPPSYGCVDCDYFIHKCCTDLPNQIHHPLRPGNQVVLRSTSDFFCCPCCKQWCNSFIYKNRRFEMDIKCALVLQGTVVYHEAHKHPLLIQTKIWSSSCIACRGPPDFKYILKCNTCGFELCFQCAVAPPLVKHRYGKSEPFKLTYSPPENYYDEYICELCGTELNPKQWFYHCVFADQFTHINCMHKRVFDSNIKYGKSHMLKSVHEHEVTTIRCTYDCSPCSDCRHPMMTGFFSVGLECKSCNFRRHLYCPHKDFD